MGMIVVSREENESNASLLRRFSKQVAVAGVLKRAKETQARQRPLSAFKKRKNALRRVTRREEILRLQKLGQLPSANVRR